jgi:hypothetical protein
MPAVLISSNGQDPHHLLQHVCRSRHKQLKAATNNCHRFIINARSRFPHSYGHIVKMAEEMASAITVRPPSIFVLNPLLLLPCIMPHIRLAPGLGQRSCHLPGTAGRPTQHSHASASDHRDRRFQKLFTLPFSRRCTPPPR